MMSQNNGEDMVQPPTENLSSGFREAEEQPAVNKSEISAKGAHQDGRTEDSLQGKVATSLEGLLSVEQADIFTYSGNRGQAIEARDSAAAEQYGGAGTSANATVSTPAADRMSAGGKLDKPRVEIQNEVKTRLGCQQASVSKTAYLQLDAKGQPQKLSGQVLFDPKTDTSGTNGGEVTPSESASQVGSKHMGSLSKTSSVATSVARTQAEAYKRQRDVARQKLRDSQRELKQIEEASSQRTRRLQGQNEQLQEQLEKLQDAQLESDRQIEVRNVQLEGELTDVQTEVARLQVELQVTGTEASVAKTRCAVAEKELIEKCRAANAASEKLRFENDALVAKQAATEEELCQLRIQFREIEGAKRSQAIVQEKEVQQLRVQIQEVESKSARAIAQKDQEIVDNLNSVRHANQSVQRREDQIQELQEDNQSLQDRLDETQKMLDVYSEQAADLASRLEQDNPPVSNQIRFQAISTHAATGDQTGTTALQSSAQFGTFYAPPLKVNAPPFQQTGGAAATNLDPTIVGATNLKTTLLAGNSSSSAAQTRNTPASAGRLKMDIPPPEKLDVTRGHASRTQFKKWKKKLKMFFELSGQDVTLWPKFIPWYLQGFAEEHVMAFLETPKGQDADFEAVMQHIENTLLHKPNAAVTMIEMRQLVYDKRKYTLNEFLQKLMEKQMELKGGEALDDKDMGIVKMDFLYKLPPAYQDFITWRDDWESASVFEFLSWADHFENRQETRDYVSRSDKRSTGFVQEDNKWSDFGNKRPIGRNPYRGRPWEEKRSVAPRKDFARKPTGADRRPQREKSERFRRSSPIKRSNNLPRKPPDNRDWSQPIDRSRQSNGARGRDSYSSQANGGSRNRSQSIDSRAPYVGKIVTCYNCGGAGHYANECKKPRSSRPQANANEIQVDQEVIESYNESDEPVTSYDLFDEDQSPLVRGVIDIDTIDVCDTVSDSVSCTENVTVDTVMSNLSSSNGLLSIIEAENRSVQSDKVYVDKGQKGGVYSADVVISDECGCFSVEAYNQQTAKASGVGEWAADLSDEPVITGETSENCDIFCDFVEVSDVHADFCDSYTLDPDSDVTCSVLDLESPGFETEKCKILAIARTEYIDSCGGQKGSYEVQMDRSDGHNLAIARDVHKNNQTELSGSRMHVDVKCHNVSVANVVEKRKNSHESVMQDVKLEKCPMRSIDHTAELRSACRQSYVDKLGNALENIELCKLASKKDDAKIDVVRPEIESFRSRSSNSNSADPKWYQGIIEWPIQCLSEFLDNSSHTMKSGRRSFAVRVRIVRIDALSLDIAENRLRLSSHLVITRSPASAAYCVSQEISVLKCFLAVQSCALLSAVITAHSKDFILFRPKNFCCPSTLIIIIAWFVLHFQVLVLEMANKKRKSPDRKANSGKGGKGTKKPEKEPDKQQQGQKEKEKPKTGQQMDDPKHPKSRLLSGASYSDRGGRERDSSERRQKPTMSEKGTSDRQEQYRKGEKRSPPVSRKRHDTPPSTGAQSDQFVVEATLQAANISATLSDADLFRMDVFNPLRDINVDISPVEPCVSTEELHLQNASIEACAREQERRDSFPSVDLRNLVQIRVKKSQAQNKLRFRAIYYGLLTQLYTQYFARRLAIKTEMAQRDTSSQDAAQATAGSTVQSQAEAAKKGLLTVIPSTASESVSVAELSQMELAIALKEIETGPFSDPELVENVILGAESDRSLTRSTTSSLASVFGAQTLGSVTIQADTTPEQDKDKTSDTRTPAPEEEKVVDTSHDSIESVTYKRSKRDQTPEPDPDALELHASGSLLPEDMAVDSDSKKESRAHISKVSIDTSQTWQQAAQPQVSIDKSVTPVGHMMEVETTPPVVSPEPYRIPRIVDTPPRGTSGPIVIKFSNEFYNKTEVRYTNMRCGIGFAAIADTNAVSNKVRNSDNYFNTRTIVLTPIAFRPGMKDVRDRFIETMLDPATQQLIRSATSDADFHGHQKEDFFYCDGRERFPAAAVLAEFAQYGFTGHQVVNMTMISTLGDSKDAALISAWIRIWDMALLCFRTMLAKEDILFLFEENEFLYFPHLPLHVHYCRMHGAFVYILRYKNRVYTMGKTAEHDKLHSRQINQVKKGLAEKWKIDLSKVPIGTRSHVQKQILSYQPPIDEMFIGRIAIPEPVPQESARPVRTSKGRGRVKARVGAPVQSEVKKVGAQVTVTTKQPTIGAYQLGTFTEELRQVFSPKDLTTPVYRTYVTAELSAADIDQHVQPQYKVYQRLLGEIPKEFGLYLEDSRRLKGREYTTQEILELVVTTVQFYGRNNDFEPMLRLIQICNAILGQLPAKERKEAIACSLGNQFGDVMGMALEFYDNHRKGQPDVRQAEPYAKLYYRQLGDHLRSYLVSMVTLQWPKVGDRVPHPENWEDVLEFLNLQAERDANPRSAPYGESSLNIEQVEEVNNVQMEMEGSPPERPTMRRAESQTISEGRSRSYDNAAYWLK